MRSIDYKITSYYRYEGKKQEPDVSYQSKPLDDFLRDDLLFSYVLKNIGVIPPIHIINQKLRKGSSKNYYHWRPFELSQMEYQEVASALQQKSDGYCIEDESLWEEPDYNSWLNAIRNKFRLNPSYKPLHSWFDENDMIGIPIGNQTWIIRHPVNNYDSAISIDTMLRPIHPLLKALETNCVADCCGLSAFGFYPENVLNTLTQQEKLKAIADMDTVRISLNNIGEHVQAFKSRRLHTTIRREDFFALMDHLEQVISSTWS